jgi:hypothetical protein
MLAVNAVDADKEQRAVEVMKRLEALEIERAEGVWRDRQWVDFDPVASPNLVYSSDQNG